MALSLNGFVRSGVNLATVQEGYRYLKYNSSASEGISQHFMQETIHFWTTGTMAEGVLSELDYLRVAILIMHPRWNNLIAQVIQVP